MAIRLFDKPPSMSATPAGVEDYVRGDAASAFNAYQGRQPGLLTAIGRALSGVSAPFLGDFDYAMKQQALQQKQDEADNEFRRYLMLSGKGRGVFTIGPDGNLISIGNIGTKDIVAKDPYAPTADMRNQGKATQQAGALFKDLRKRSEALKGSYAGIGEIGKSVVNRGKGESAAYKTYMANLPGSAVSIYRALTGDTRLSDADAQSRALPFLWNPTEHEDTRTEKNNFIQSMIDARERLMSSGRYSEGVIPWEDIVEEAGQEVTPENGDIQTFNIGKKRYDIPKDKVPAFKKAKGIK